MTCTISSTFTHPKRRKRDDRRPYPHPPLLHPDFEAGIWGAVIDNKRDWDDIEKEYLRRNQGIRESIIDWCAFMNNGNATDANLEFLGQYSEVSAEVLTRPSADHTQRQEKNSIVKDLN